ncbi:DNA-directed RNA polymerases I, II, and III subunit RPABC3 [Nosema granulosis]|uniref:DNA-directed RNA polymerases I, II, and III subunit RPABC3 n=1 Tax=Nosema granulosis TaxID=83296 RepID=A0A9P6KZC0_9MICR|nr:DNA-directed RNA polymerases I, II, and III subunit RPABC3 [Nosema granulosis]
MILLNKKMVVSDIDKEGKLYSNVSRAYLKADDSTEIVLDYHSILLRISKDDVLYLQLFEGEEKVECEYQMNGMVYKIEDLDGRVEVWISFGGLLMIQKIAKDQIVGLNDRSRVSLAISKV